MEESNCVVVNRSMSAKNHSRSTTTGRFRHIGMVLAGLVCTSGILVVSPSLASASSKPTPACTIDVYKRQHFSCPVGQWTHAQHANPIFILGVA